MAFGRYDIKTTKVADNVAFGLGVKFELGFEFRDLLLAVVALGVKTLCPHIADGHTLGITTQQDVDTTTGHIRSHRDRMQSTRLGHDFGFSSVLLGVENLVGDVALFEEFAELFALLDRNRTDQYRLAFGVPGSYVVGNSVVFRCFGLENQINFVFANQRQVRRNLDHVQSVGGVKFGGLGLGRTGHTSEFLVQPEVVLQRDRGERLILFLDLHAFFGFDRLMQAVAPTPTFKDATGEIVNDLYLAIVDDVFLVAGEEFFGSQRHTELVHIVTSDRVVQVVDVE